MPEIKLESMRYRGHKLTIGHPVRVLPSKKGGRDGFDANIRGILGKVMVTPEGKRKGAITGVVVADARGSTRVFAPERIVPYLRNVEAKAQAIADKHGAAMARERQRAAASRKPKA